MDLLRAFTPILTGLRYVRTFSIEEYKAFYSVSTIYVKVNLKTKLLFFIDEQNVGDVIKTKIPNNSVISVVSNSYGDLFFLLHELEDIGKDNYTREYYIQSKAKSNRNFRQSRTSLKNYENEKMHEDWGDPYGDNRAYNGGWNQEDVDSGLADAFEGDIGAYDIW